MQLTETIKLKHCRYTTMVTDAMACYIKAVNDTVSLALSGISIAHFGSADINEPLNSAIRNQVARDARSVVRRYQNALKTIQNANVPVLKCPCLYINNQNFSINDNKDICIPLVFNGKSKRIALPTHMTDKQYERLKNAKLGTMRIVLIGRKLCAQVVYEAEESANVCGQVMGVDLGIKCPAVSYTEDGNIKFYGNGRWNKYMRRHYAYLRKKLQKKKKLKAVTRINNKEQRIMKDIDHKLSRRIVDHAVKHNVGVIKLEQLSNIRSTTRKSRKNNHSLHNWSFYRLSRYIEYKAAKAGIAVIYVNPAYTSQKCPSCGDIHHAHDRHYNCKCGFHTHRDILGAMNICLQAEPVGDAKHIRPAA